MTTVNLQITDIDGNVKEEKTLELTEGSNLIVKVPLSYGGEFISEIADIFNRNLGNGKPIFIPENIELLVVQVK